MMELPSETFLAMLKTHGDPNCEKDDMIWFVAWQEGQGERDCYDSKDSAQDIVAGKLPMAERIEETLALMFEGWEPTAIISLIHEFYGKS